MLPLPLSDVIRERNSAHVRKRSRPPLVNTGQVVSREDVKCVIKTQLQGDIVAGEFDVGIVSSASVISIRSEADVKELWADIQMGKKLYSGAMA